MYVLRLSGGACFVFTDLDGEQLEVASNQTIEILTNREIIAINQDSVVGTGVTPFRWGINPDYISNDTHPAQYWSGESQNGTVFMLASISFSALRNGHCHDDNRLDQHVGRASDHVFQSD